MTLLLAWIVFPLLLCLLACGCGLLLESAAGARLPQGMLLPAGLAVVIVAANFTTASARTAPLTVPLLVALAVSGFALAFPWRERSIDPWLACSALAVFALYAAPVVLSGQATFAGYIKLDDTATFLAFTDRAMEHGRSLAGLAPSSHEAALAVNIPFGYPLGSFLPLGAGSRLVATDPVWLFQPCIALYAAMLALALGPLTSSLIRSRRLRALAAFAGAQAALLYGFSLWGGIKELAAAFLIVTACVLAPAGGDDLRPARRLIPFAVACAALFAVLNVSAAFWLLPLALPALVIVARKRTRRLSLPVGAGLGLTLALSLPTLVIAHDFYRYSSSNLLTSSQRLGNLAHPLNPLQMLGVWPSGDFRFWPGERVVTVVLVAITALAAAGTLVIALRRRLWRLPLLAGTAVVVAIALERTSTPWLAGKAYTAASPVLLVAAVGLAAILAERGFRIEALLLALLVGGGVLWSNALAYHEVWLAPRAQLRELEQIGDLFAGQGPTLMTEYQPYGVRHFLRDMDAEGASELRRRAVPLADGGTLDKAEFADTDRLATSGLLIYRTLVLRRSPVESRPPSPFSLLWQGRYYEVWQRGDPPAPHVQEHLALGDALHAAASPSCTEVLRLADVATAAGGRLVAAAASIPVTISFASSSHPPDWQLDADSTDLIVPTSSGTLGVRVSVPAAGAYMVWLGGSFAGKITISVDGRRVGSLRGILNEAGQWSSFGSVWLPSGSHNLSLRYESSRLRPGDGAGPFTTGPLVLHPAEPSRALIEVSPSSARSLCGRSLDWIEAVSG